VLLTTGTNLRYPQDLKGRRLAVVILSKNRWNLIRPMLTDIALAIVSAKPGTYSVVEISPGKLGLDRRLVDAIALQ
jgi:ABC-type taurine transport system substrate-binding protein